MALLTDINALAQTPSSVLNFITGSDSSSGWAGTNATVTTNTTSGFVPAFPVRTTSIKIDVTSAGGYGATSFTVPSGVGELVGVSFYYETNDLTASNWTIELWNGGTQITLPSSALVGTTVGLPFGFSVTLVKGQTYNIRFKSAASGKQIYLNGVTVGTSIPTQGAALSDPVTFTATLAATTSNPTVGYAARQGSYSRIGSNILIQYHVNVNSYSGGSGNITISGLPAGITFSSLNAGQSPGNATWWDNSAVTLKLLTPVVSGTSLVFVTTAGAVLSVTDFAVGDELYVNVIIPVAEWASSGVVNLGAGAQVEYAFNSDVSDGNTLSSGFSYGPAGTVFGSFSTANRAKAVRFQYPIQPDDTLILEVTRNGSWVPVEYSDFATLSSTTGMACIPANSTDVYVYFGSAGYPSTLLGSSSPWSGIANNAAFKWRVRKCKANSPVGFGMASPTTPGLTRKGATAVYKASSAQSFTSGANTQVNFATLVSDDGSRVTNPASAWRFTSQVSGFLDVRGVMRLDRSSGSWSLGNQMELTVTKNGTVFADLAFNQYSGANGTTASQGLSGATMVPVAIGDYVEIVVFHNGGAGVTGGATSQAWVSVQEIPN